MSESPAKPSHVPPRPPPPRLPPQKPIALGNGGREGEIREIGFHTVWKKMEGLLRNYLKFLWGGKKEGYSSRDVFCLLPHGLTWFYDRITCGLVWDILPLVFDFLSSLPSFGELFMSISSFICSLATKEI